MTWRCRIRPAADPGRAASPSVMRRAVLGSTVGPHLIIFLIVCLVGLVATCTLL
jgi:hypothetical protein